MLVKITELSHSGWTKLKTLQTAWCHGPIWESHWLFMNAAQLIKTNMVILYSMHQTRTSVEWAVEPWLALKPHTPCLQIEKVNELDAPCLLLDLRIRRQHSSESVSSINSATSHSSIGSGNDADSKKKKKKNWVRHPLSSNSDPVITRGT